MTSVPTIRKGQASWPLSQEEFSRRFRRRFADPRFESLGGAIDDLLEIAWKDYCEARKAPRTRKAGPEFAEPDYDLSIDWLETRTALLAAAQRHKDPAGPNRVLLICASARTRSDR